MIAGIFHPGSGLGNQLHRYVMTRVLAVDKGYEWGMVYVGDFKGRALMSIEERKWDDNPHEMSRFEEKKIVENGIDVRGYDPEINFVQDNTIIDGEFQDERYFEHRLPEIRKWLKVEQLEMPNDLCVINLRGGEYAAYPDLFLTSEYWNSAIAFIQAQYPAMQFEVHTDDRLIAEAMFPQYPVVTGIAINWRSIRYAKHLILSNSSFAILPALLNENVQEVIAPRYWARRNTGVWALPQNYYKQFTYL